MSESVNDEIKKLRGSIFVVLTNYIDSPDTCATVADRIERIIVSPFTTSQTKKAVNDCLDRLEKNQDILLPCDCQFNMGFAYKKGMTCSGQCVTANLKKRQIYAIQQERNQVKGKL